MLDNKVYDKKAEEYKSMALKKLRVPLLTYTGKILHDLKWFAGLGDIMGVSEESMPACSASGGVSEISPEAFFLETALCDTYGSMIRFMWNSGAAYGKIRMSDIRPLHI